MKDIFPKGGARLTRLLQSCPFGNNYTSSSALIVPIELAAIIEFLCLLQQTLDTNWWASDAASCPSPPASKLWQVMGEGSALVYTHTAFFSEPQAM